MTAFKTRARPKRVVLDTNREIIALMRQLELVLPLLRRGRGDQPRFDDIFEALISEEDALANLAQFANDIATEAELVNPVCINADTTRREIYDFGKFLYRRLLRYELYDHRRLHYHFKAWCGGFIILEYRPDVSRYNRRDYQQNLRL